LVGYSEGVGRLTRREVLQASRELKRGDRADDRQRKWFYMVAVAGLLVVLGLVWQMRLISLSPPSVGNDVSAATGSGVLQSDRSPGSVPKGAQE
jgi:hypothetical protein